MAALKNPYLSNDSQNFLLRKNYNVIKSPSKDALYTGFTSNINKINNNTLNIKNQQSATSIGGESSSVSGRNPFSSKALGQRNINFPYYNSNLPSFYTQPYLPSVQKKQLPFPSYNRPQSNRGVSFSANKVSNILSLSRRNLAVSNVGNIQSSSLQKNMNGSYRPHFVSPKQNNEWNTQRWKKDLQKQQRKKLTQFGPEALRYDSKISSNLNNEYYSTNNVQNQYYNYKIKTQKPRQPIKQKNFLFQDNEQQSQHQKNQYLNNTHQSSSSNSLNIPRDPDTYHSKKPNIKNFSDIREQSQIQNFQSKIDKFNHDDDHFMKNSRHQMAHNNSSIMEDYKSFVKDQDQYEANKFMSKYDQRDNKKSKKGPLDLDVFDSGNQRSQSHNGLMNDSRYKDSEVNQFGSGTFGAYNRDKGGIFKTNNREQKGSSYAENRNRLRDEMKQRGQRNGPVRDYPQRLQFRNRFYYRIKLNEDKK